MPIPVLGGSFFAPQPALPAATRLTLIVFDECHLLHPREEDRSRRGLDAMLTLLNLTKIAPDADLLLLSAMMKNTTEIASWIASLTGRDCLPLDLAWKPTRQVRGCVVYPADQIATLNAKLTQARRARPKQASTPAAVKRELMAHPFGLFGLLQTWSTTAREDYSLLPLLQDPQLLSTSTGRRWYLTPNGNHVSSAIAAASASAGIKTLVFVQTTVFCESCVKGFPDRISDGRRICLASLTVEEMGGAEHCYVQLDTDGLLKTGAASHHSLLLREERDLHESLFKRRDGIDVLFATSTLAQGMNLPSEVVIISGDSRFDPGADKMKKLEAHELLNAAGRARSCWRRRQGVCAPCSQQGYRSRRRAKHRQRRDFALADDVARGAALDHAAGAVVSLATASKSIQFTPQRWPSRSSKLRPYMKS